MWRVFDRLDRPVPVESIFFISVVTEREGGILFDVHMSVRLSEATDLFFFLCHFTFAFGANRTCVLALCCRIVSCCV